MRVLALGAGATGREAALAVAATPGVTTLVVADRDRRTADRVADDVGAVRGAAGPVVRAVTVDVTDPQRLGEVLSDADVVMNTVGPYYRFGPTVLAAAVEARTHYVDICDDPAPTSDLLALDERAVTAGVTAIVGAGASPGVSNLLAAAAVGRLDTVEDLFTAWPVDTVGVGGLDRAALAGADGQPGAAAVHWMEQLRGLVPAVVDGAPATMAPLTPVQLRLPGGGTGHAYVVGHPEPLTLGGSFDVQGMSACLMVLRRWTAAYLDTLREDMDRGRLTPNEAAGFVTRTPAGRILRSLVRLPRFPGPGALPPMFALATGSRGGSPRCVLARLEGYGLDSMARATGVPLAIATAQVIAGTARRPGVHPPERILDHAAFLRELSGGVDRLVLEESPLAGTRWQRLPA